MSIGPNVRKLWAVKLAKDAIPDGGGFADGLKFLGSKKSISAGAKAASEWTQKAIQAVRQAAEPNPWKNADDEVIAGELLRLIELRRAPAPTPEKERGKP